MLTKGGASKGDKKGKGKEVLAVGLSAATTSTKGKEKGEERRERTPLEHPVDKATA